MSLLLLHSSGLGARQWSRLLGRLPPSIRCSAPNLSGYGEVPEDPDRPAEAADLAVAEAALAGLPDPVHLIGHSYGGVLALELARRHPERIGRVVVHEPIALGVLAGTGSPEEAAFTAALQRIYGEGEPGDAGWMRRFISFWGGPEAWEALPPVRRRALLAVGPKVAAEVRGIAEDRRSGAYWSELRAPTLITAGRDSPAEELSVCRVLAEAMPTARLQMVDGDHMAPVTAVEALLPVWLEFLGPA